MPANGPADTLSYYVAGYVIFFVVSVIYIASLALRRRSLIQDLETLEEIDKEKGKTEAVGFQTRVEAPETAARQSGESRV